MKDRLSQKKATAALDDVRREANIVGAAVDASETITFFLEEESDVARAACERWGVSHETPISVKVIGRIVI